MGVSAQPKYFPFVNGNECISVLEGCVCPTEIFQFGMRDYK